jgi:predicted 3-demethylubiquinone-9 3-methyltransferase (glyoxalase superfamily)
VSRSSGTWALKPGFRQDREGPNRPPGLKIQPEEIDVNDLDEAINVAERIFNEAVSLYVNCETQAEVDELWERLSAGGEPGRCGWLKDQYGLSWQIIPKVLNEMVQDKDAARVQRVTAAMMQMNKLDIAALQRAYEQA